MAGPDDDPWSDLPDDHPRKIVPGQWPHNRRATDEPGYRVREARKTVWNSLWIAVAAAIGTTLASDILQGIKNTVVTIYNHITIGWK